jgi:hypothetical protein
MFRKQKAAPGFKGRRGGFVPALRRRSAIPHASNPSGIACARLATACHSAVMCSPFGSPYVVTITDLNLDRQVFLLRGADYQSRRYEMRSSKKVRKSKPYRRLISHETLRRKMSELISLRERVAQAELDVSGARLRQIGRTGSR